MQLVRRSKEAFCQQLGRPPEKSPYVSSSLLSTYEQESETCKDWLYQLDWDEEKTLTCATWDMLNLFPKRVKSSIASFVLRASGSWKEEFCTITYYQRPGNTGLKEKKEVSSKSGTCQLIERCQSTWRVSMCASAPLIIIIVGFCTSFFLICDICDIWHPIGM